MTTVKKIARHKVRKIEQELQAKLTAIPGGMTPTDLLPLSAFLCMTGQSLGKGTFGRGKGKKIATRYLAALYSKRLLGKQSLPSSYMRARRFKQSVEALGCRLDVNLSVTGVPEQLLPQVNEFDVAEHVEEEIWRWSGWPVVSQGGVTQYLHLEPVYEVLGRPFTDNLHAVYKAYKKARKGATLSSAPAFVEFIADLGSSTCATAWQSHDNVDRYILEFGEFYFRRVDKLSLDFSSAAKVWNREITYVFSALADRATIATPTIAVPLVHLGKRAESGASTMLVDSLMLSIPSGLSDRQLKETIYGRLTSAVDLIRCWANNEIDEIWARKKRAVALESTGRVRRFMADGDQVVRLIDDATWEADCCATFKEYGHNLENYRGKSIATPMTVYERPSLEVAHTVCLPLRGSLLPHAALIVATHPEVTTSMLENMEIYESASGEHVIRGDASSKYILLYKNRKGPESAETRVNLTDRTKEVIEQVLLLTQPLRSYLKSIGDPNYKKVFLTVSGCSTRPRVEHFSALCTRSKNVSVLQRRLKNATGESMATVKRLTDAFSLRTLRTTIGVIVYLKTGSTQRMAVALGHTGHNPQLIDRYLPRALRSLIEEYWIRTFQMSLIATALNDSGFLRIAMRGENPLRLMNSVKFDFVNSLANKKVTSSSRKTRTSSRLVIDVSEASLTEMLIYEASLVDRESPSNDELMLGSFIRTLVKLIDSTANRPDWTTVLARSRATASSQGVRV